MLRTCKWTRDWSYLGARSNSLVPSRSIFVENYPLQEQWSPEWRAESRENFIDHGFLISKHLDLRLLKKMIMRKFGSSMISSVRKILAYFLLIRASGIVRDLLSGQVAHLEGQIEYKNEESGTLAHPGLWGWLHPWSEHSKKVICLLRSNKTNKVLPRSKIHSHYALLKSVNDVVACSSSISQRRNCKLLAKVHTH